MNIRIFLTKAINSDNEKVKVKITKVKTRDKKKE